jgi:hypothetical protein
LEAASDVAGAPMQVQFDPKVLRLNDVVLGDFFARDGEQPIFTKNILNDTGMAVIQLNRFPGSPGITGGGVLVTLNFQAVGKGATTVTIPSLAVKNTKGQVAATGNPQLSVNVK